ncbi:MAG: hypothetical protein AAGF77_09435, partial [Bacteroidota bacterium]
MMKLRLSLLTVLLFFSMSKLLASDIIEIVPITETIVLLHFDDGSVDHADYLESKCAETFVNIPLDTTAVLQPNVFTISSIDDGAFGTFSPSIISRKSKIMDLARPFCSDRADIYDHWVYLHLPSGKKFSRNKNYTVSWSSSTLNTSVSFATFEFDEFNVYSDAVHVNQIGMNSSASKKYGYLSAWLGIDKDGTIHRLELDDLAGNAFHIVDAVDRSNIVFSGTIQQRTDFETDFSPDTKRTDFIRDRINGNYAGSDVWECDFSGLSASGEYVLVVEGMGCSFPFKMSNNAYADPFYLVTRMLYLQRAGIEMPASNFGQWARPRSLHFDDVDIKLINVRSIDQKGETGKDPDVASKVIGDFDTYGWYRDAGDWDGYVRHLP